MSQERLTDRNLLTAQAASNNLRFYVVDKDKTDEHPDGDSFQVSREALIEILGSNTPSTTPGYEVIDFGDSLLFESAGATTTIDEIESLINTTKFEIKAGKLAVFHIALIREINGRPTWVREQYRFLANNVTGMYGTGEENGEIEFSDFDYNSMFVMYVPPPQSEIINLGDIGTSTIEDYLNALDGNTVTWENLLDDGTSYFFRCIISGSDKFYKYVGTLPVTLGTDTVLNTDFDLQDYNNNPEPAPIPTENQIEFKIQEATVSGTFELDLDTYSDFYLTMTAATELSFKAGTLPAEGFGKRFKMVLTGAFPQTWADAYMNSFGDDYEGTKLNDVLCEVAHLAAGYRGEAIYQQRETA